MQSHQSIGKQICFFFLGWSLKQGKSSVFFLGCAYRWLRDEQTAPFLLHKKTSKGSQQGWGWENHQLPVYSWACSVLKFQLFEGGIVFLGGGGMFKKPTISSPRFTSPVTNERTNECTWGVCGTVDDGHQSSQGGWFSMPWAVPARGGWN